MKNACQYLDDAKAARGIGSDYALAKALGIRTTAISNYRVGRSSFDETVALKVADLIGIDPAEIFAAMQAHRSKTPEARKVWEGAWENFSKGFRTLVLRANACGAWVPQV